MYGAGAVLIFLPMIFGYLFGTAGSGGMIVFAMSAKSWYVRTALGRIAKADEMGLTGADRYDYLQRAGGVSLTGGLLAGFVYACLLMLLIVAIFARRHHIGH